MIMKKIYPLILLCLVTASGLFAQTLWDNFQDTRKGTYGFISGTFIPYLENPDQTGANTSLVCAQYTRNPAETFDVLILDGQMADLGDYTAGTKTMTMDVWSPAAGTTVQITLENDVLAQPANFPTGRHSVYLATTSVAMGWETLTFTFDNQPDPAVANDNVNRIVILFAPNTNTDGTYFWDNFNGPEFASDPCDGVTPDASILNDFECNQNVDYIFSHSGVNFRRIVNPDQTGNTSDYVGRYVRNGGEEFDVLIGKFDGNLSLEANSAIELDVWSSVAKPVRLSLQNDNNDVILAVDQTTSGNSAWETLSFFVGDVSAATDISQFVILFDPETFNQDEYFFDNFKLGIGTSVEELEEVTAFEVLPNPSPGQTTFQYELNSRSDVNLVIHDMTGKVVAKLVDESQVAGQHQVEWNANDLANGLYFYTMSIDGKIASGKVVLSK